MKKIVVFSALILLTLTLFGQKVIKKEEAIESGEARLKSTESNVKFLPLPYVNYNRSIGFMVGAAPMVQFRPMKNDTLSPMTTIGVMGLYSFNKSWVASAFASLYLKEDNWRITAAGGYGTLNFQFYLEIINIWIPYNASADFAYLGIDRRIFKDVYLSVSYMYAKIGNTISELPFTEYSTLQGLGLGFTADYKDNVYNPGRGFKSDLTYKYYPVWMGNKNQSNSVNIDHNHYIPVRRSKDVLAARAFCGFGIGDLTFNQQYIVGGTDIRGYTQGKYRGENLLSLQAEYRWNPLVRFGFVGFAGVATNLESFNKEYSGKVLGAGGFGFRYVFSKETNFRVGIDLAAGQDDWGIYFRIGEAF